MHEYNTINNVLVPIGQRYEDFIKDWRLWEDSPSSRLKAINEYTDSRVHLPENFVEEYNKFILKEDPEKERDFLIKVLGPRRQEEDNTEHTLKHMAAIWVLTGDAVRAWGYASLERKYTSVAKDFEAISSYISTFMDDYKNLHQPDIGKEETSGNSATSTLSPDATMEEKVEWFQKEATSEDIEDSTMPSDAAFSRMMEWHKKVDNQLRKKFPEYYPAYKAIREKEDSEIEPWNIGVSYRKRFADIAAVDLDNFKQEVIKEEKFARILSVEDYNKIRQLLQKSGANQEHLTQYDKVVQELVGELEKREFLIARQPNIEGLFHDISERTNKRGLQ